MSTADKIIEEFPHPTVTPIVGQPAFDTIKALKLLLSTNTASVINHLGNGALGLLSLVVSNTVYNTISAKYLPSSICNYIIDSIIKKICILNHIT